jgi:hypothetical protein
MGCAGNTETLQVASNFSFRHQPIGHHFIMTLGTTVALHQYAFCRHDFLEFLSSYPWGRAGVFYRKPCSAMLKMGSADPISMFDLVVAHRAPPKTER